MTTVTVPVSLGGDGLPFSDAGESARDMQNMGHAVNFMPMVKQVVAASAITITAAAAALGGATTNLTSTSSVAVGTGAKAFTVEPGKAIVIGMTIKMAATAAPANYMVGDVTAYDSVTGALSLNVTVTNGSGTIAAWTGSVTGLPASSGVTTSARTSNTILTAADKGKFIHITSGTFSQTFDPAASLGSTWFAYYKNAGSGTVTLDPNAAETINGAATLALKAGESALLFCDGASLTACVIPAAFPGSSLAASGYQRLPSGLIIQWGQVAATPSSQTFSFPIAFPTVCVSIAAVGIGAGAASAGNLTTTTFVAAFNSNSATLYYIAIGY